MQTWPSLWSSDQWETSGKVAITTSSCLRAQTAHSSATEWGRPRRGPQVGRFNGPPFSGLQGPDQRKTQLVWVNVHLIESKLTSALVEPPRLLSSVRFSGGHNWQRVRQQWPYVGDFLPMLFTLLGPAILLGRRKSSSVVKNKVTLLPWTDMGHALKCLSSFHVGLGEGYNNLPPKLT